MKLAFGITLGAFLGIAAAFLLVHAGTSSPLPAAYAQTVAAEPGGVGVVVGIGGATPNQNDLCWVVFREKAKDRQGNEYDRTALALYKAQGNGAFFDLMDAREITYDGKPAQLAVGTHNPKLTPQVLKEGWEEAKRKEAEQRRREEDANRNRRGN